MDNQSLIKEAFTAAYQAEAKSIYANFSNKILYAKGNLDEIKDAEVKKKFTIWSSGYDFAVIDI